MCHSKSSFELLLKIGLAEQKWKENKYFVQKKKKKEVWRPAFAANDARGSDKKDGGGQDEENPKPSKDSDHLQHKVAQSAWLVISVKSSSSRSWKPERDAKWRKPCCAQASLGSHRSRSGEARSRPIIKISLLDLQINNHIVNIMYGPVPGLIYIIRLLHLHQGRWGSTSRRHACTVCTSSEKSQSSIHQS